MLWTIFIILLVLWLLGLVTSYTMGGFIHVLIVILPISVCCCCSENEALGASRLVSRRR